jgi:amidase
VAQFLTLWTVGQAYELDHWSRRANRRVTEQDVEALTWALAEMGRAYTAVDLMRTQESLLRLSHRVALWFERFDILLTPTLAEPPPPLGEFVSTADNPLMPIFRAATITPFTPMFNATGQPAMSMPLSWNQDDLPIGVHFVGAYGREDVLIRLATQLESALPWAGRRPSIHA